MDRITGNRISIPGNNVGRLSKLVPRLNKTVLLSLIITRLVGLSEVNDHHICELKTTR